MVTETEQGVSTNPQINIAQEHLSPLGLGLWIPSFSRDARGQTQQDLLQRSIDSILFRDQPSNHMGLCMGLSDLANSGMQSSSLSKYRYENILDLKISHAGISEHYVPVFLLSKDEHARKQNPTLVGFVHAGGRIGNLYLTRGDQDPKKGEPVDQLLNFTPLAKFRKGLIEKIFPKHMPLDETQDFNSQLECYLG